MNRPVVSRVIFLILIGVLAAGLVGVTGFTLITQADTIHSQQSRIHDLNVQTSALIDDLSASQENGQQLYDQLLELGANPDGENPDQVVTAIPSEPGAPGPRGDVGRPPTANEILGAVGQYCASSGACQGVPGQTGASIVGPTGATGPSGESVVGPIGPAGESITGPAGPVGADGQSAFPFTFTFTDPAGIVYTCIVSTAEESTCVTTTPIPEGATP